MSALSSTFGLIGKKIKNASSSMELRVKHCRSHSVITGSGPEPALLDRNMLLTMMPNFLKIATFFYQVESLIEFIEIQTI
jgi:hypothetical protein